MEAGRRGALLVHDVAEEEHRLDHDEDCEMHGGQARRHRGNLGALHHLLCRILQANENQSSGHAHSLTGFTWPLSAAAARRRPDPDLSAALDQVLHVPLDQVKMLLDVVEVLDGLVRPHAARRALLLVLLRRADLLQRLVEGVPAATEQNVSLRQRAEALQPQKDLFYSNNLWIYRSCFY